VNSSRSKSWNGNPPFNTLAKIAPRIELDPEFTDSRSPKIV